MPAKQTFYNLTQEKQEKIIEVAIAEFAEHGYQKASLNNIIADLGIAKGSMYQYFDNKEGLFLYIFEYAIRLVKNYLRLAERELQPEHSVFTKLFLFFTSAITFVKNYPLIFRLYLKTVFESEVPFKEEIIKKIHISSVEYLIPLLEDGRRAGEIRQDISPQLMAFILDAVIDRFLQVRLGSYLAGEQDITLNSVDCQQEAREIIEVLKTGFKNGDRC